MGMFKKIFSGSQQDEDDYAAPARHVERQAVKLKPTEFNFNDTLKDVANILTREALAKHVAIVYRVDKNVPSSVIGDRYKLATVLTSLIGNAIDFTETKNEKVIVAVKRNPENNDALELHFEIIDHGIGISPEAVGELIMPMLRSDQPAGAFGIEGMGLERSRDIVHAMQGSIMMECEEGKGCKVKFHLMLSAKDLNEKRHYRLPSKAGVGLKTLIIDDDVGSANALKGMLEYFRHKVTVSHNHRLRGFEAYDLVIFSSHFYNKDTEQYLQQLHKEHEIKIVLIENMLQQRQDDREALHATDWLIFKPFTQQFVFDMLAALYDGQKQEEAQPSQEKKESAISTEVDNFLTRGVISPLALHKGITKCQKNAHQFFVAADGLQECDNNYEEFIERLKEILWKYVKADRVVQRLNTEKNYDELITYCTEMKSTLSKLGIYRVSCLCDLIEHACNSNRPQDIQVLANASTYIIAQTITAIDQFLEESKFRKS